VSREVIRHGGRPAYRAHEADSQAWQSALRPKRCLLAVNRCWLRRSMQHPQFNSHDNTSCQRPDLLGSAHMAAERQVFGLVNDAHPAAAQPLDDAVVGDGLANEWIGPRHDRIILGCEKKPVNETDTVVVQINSE
jgi:hypothetical protein